MPILRLYTGYAFEMILLFILGSALNCGNF